MPEQIDVTITYLEMRADPRQHAPVPAGKLALIHAPAPPLHFYRYLYETVGGDYMWIDRRNLDDDKLAKLVQSDKVEVYVLYLDGAPAGFAELSFRDFPEVELMFLGLMPHAIGRGLGRYLLCQAIDIAWARGPSRLIVQTCTLDHPSALNLYQKCGFKPYAQSNTTITPPAN